MNNYRKASPFDPLLNQPKKSGSPYSEEAERQRKYFHLAARLRKVGGLNPADQEYLISVFEALSKGIDPREVFGGKPPRGTRTRGAYAAQSKRDLVKSFIAQQILPEADGGRGLVLDAALTLAAQEFGYAPSTIKRYWHESDKEAFFVL
jgi:hypothetical protein